VAENQRLVRLHILRKDFGGGDEGVATVKREGEEEVLVLFPRRKSAEEFMKKAPGCAGMETYAPSSFEEISRICAEHSIGLVALYQFFGTDIDVLKVEDLPQAFTVVSQ
jgi:hypothetical protein